MRIKHITFHDVERTRWIDSQRRWLEASIGSGGLLDAWGAETNGDARAVFTWRDEAALQQFMEVAHDRALADVGSVGRYAVLYLDEVESLGARGDATYVAESFAWIKEGGTEAWLESQRAWSSALVACPGFRGGNIHRGRRTFVVTSFWENGDAHRRYLDDVVPRLRDATRGDEHTARLVRFEGALSPELSFRS
jgi:heme-degrading monooxygenase HmoA